MASPAISLREWIARKPPESACSPWLPSLGLQQGAITEISGARSSGRTTLLQSTLANATAAGELCALVDGSDAFDPASASAAGVKLDRLLWFQAHHDLRDTLQAADLILHSALFRLVLIDLCDFEPRELQQLPASAWHRFRLSIENSPGVAVVFSSQPVAKQAAAVQLQLEAPRAKWSGTLLDGLDFRLRLRKPMHRAGEVVHLRAAAR